MRRTACGWLFFAVAYFFSALAAFPQADAVRYALTIRDKEHRILASIPLTESRFEYRYVHSFHLTPVAERFIVEQNADGMLYMRLYELEYESVGVGMPADAEQGYRLVDGKFVVAMNRHFSSIALMVSIVPGHGIASGKIFRPFTAWAPQESMLFIEPAWEAALESDNTREEDAAQ